VTNDTPSTVTRIEQLPGYIFDQRRHGLTILRHDFPEAHQELIEILGSFEIHPDEAMTGGGGKTSMTYRLEHGLLHRGWKNKAFRVSETIDGREIDSTTHTIDHYNEPVDSRPGIALEIEWNNKDTFFDRDLSAFQRLHRLGAISVGLVITRSESLQQKLRTVFMESHRDQPQLAAEWLLNKSATMRAKMTSMPDSNKRQETIGLAAFNYKYGASTTHWSKLMEKLSRNQGDPCPLVLIGIGGERLVDR
jgi:hypothetical protein